MVRGAVDLVGHIDTVVLNASMPFAVIPFSEYTWESFEEKLRGELGAAFHCCKALVPAMIQRGEGCIIAVSSVLSRRPGNG
jgi:3-oxoacyl-[acyl-carrier protein] reductase